MPLADVPPQNLEAEEAFAEDVLVEDEPALAEPEPDSEPGDAETS